MMRNSGKSQFPYLDHESKMRLLKTHSHTSERPGYEARKNAKKRKRPHDNRVLGELTLSHHATTGVSAYAIDPTATDGGSHLLYDGTVGVTLSNEPQLLEVNLVRSNGSPAPTGHYLVDMLPPPGILSMQEHFVASGWKVLPLTGVADLEPGDQVGVAHAPLLSVPLGALCHATEVSEPPVSYTHLTLPTICSV